eukprot:249070-Rhodomonas_salina.1
MSGTELAHGARFRRAWSGSRGSEGQRRSSLRYRTALPYAPPSLCASSAMSATAIPHALSCLRACYAMSGTAIGLSLIHISEPTRPRLI